jgi:uncharacterized coiled-coil DUF342 family protein
MTLDGLGIPLEAGGMAIVGGIVIKLLEKFMGKDKEDFDKNMALRNELREEIDRLYEKVEELTKQVDEWRTKYWEQVEELSTLKVENQSLHIKLQGHEEQLRKIDQFTFITTEQPIRRDDEE